MAQAISNPSLNRDSTPDYAAGANGDDSLCPSVSMHRFPLSTTYSTFVSLLVSETLGISEMSHVGLKIFTSTLPNPAAIGRKINAAVCSRLALGYPITITRNRLRSPSSKWLALGGRAVKNLPDDRQTRLRSSYPYFGKVRIKKKKKINDAANRR